MRRCLYPTFLLAVVLSLAACGTKSDGASIADLIDRLYVSQEGELPALIEEIGRRGRADPEVAPLLVERMRQERVDPLKDTIRFEVDTSAAVAQGKDPTLVLRGVVSVMARRLVAFGYTNAHFDENASDGVITMGIPRRRVGEHPSKERMAVERAYLALLLHRLTAPGSIELMLEARPPEEGLTPPSLWGGSRESFDAYVKGEAARMEKAAEESAAYVPSRVDFPLARLRPSAEGEPSNLILLFRAPDAKHVFDRTTFALTPVELTDASKYAFHLAIRADRQADLAAWTGAHVGHRLALVVNAQAEVLVRLAKPQEDVLILPLGPLGDQRTQRWIQGVMNAVGPGALPAPVTGRIQNDVPADQITPAMRALAEIGVGAADALMALRAEGESLGSRAVRTLELIGQSQISGAK